MFYTWQYGLYEHLSENLLKLLSNFILLAGIFAWMNGEVANFCVILQEIEWIQVEWSGLGLQIKLLCRFVVKMLPCLFNIDIYLD